MPRENNTGIIIKQIKIFPEDQRRWNKIKIELRKKGVKINDTLLVRKFIDKWEASK